jgi:4-aminobutyrate aminotransferase
VLQIIERDGLLANASETGAHLLKGLKKIESRYDPVRNARGLGLMLALTIDGQGQAERLMYESFKRGLLIFTCGFDAVRIIPPLDVTVREADMALNILNRAAAAIF